MRDVYLLQSGYFLDQYCVGVTPELKQRLVEHNAPSADSNGFFAILACK
jgi:predicted GIY-YIG superfamily endonuclease